MQRPSLGGSSSQKKYLYLLAALFLIFVPSWLAYKHFHNNQSGATGDNASFMSVENDDAQQAINSKDYQSALQALIRSGTAAISVGNWQQAKSTYLKAINSIPDKYIDWTVYDSLYVVAENLNDKNLQVSSLQKALAKAQKAGSGAPASTIDLYKSRLQQLGAK